MIRILLRLLSLRGLFFTAILALAAIRSAPSAFAYDPYQSRQDREYKSLAGAISRAYAPPPPSSSPSRGYSSPAYSSSSNASSARSSSPSYSGRTSAPVFESYGQITQRYANDATAQQAASEGRERLRALDAIKEAAMWDRIRSADRRAALANQRATAVYSRGEWEVLTRDTQGKLPLSSPTHGHMESPRTEFAHFSVGANLRKAEAPWENMRAGQMCLLFQGDDASPARAFDYFSNSNRAWPEVQLGLGMCYLYGYGVTPDPVKAREFLEKAAAYVQPAKLTRYVGGGDAFQDIAYEGCRELAMACDLGRGLPADPILAAQWYDRAQDRPLYNKDYDAIRALKREFWKRHANAARQVLEREFAAAKTGAERGAATPSGSLFQDLRDAGDAQALYEIGDFADTKDRKGGEITGGRSGVSYFLAAAKLGHDPAARAFFSPSKNGAYANDLDGDPFWTERADFTREQWPVWEKKWQAAAGAGDATANIPLAFHYSGARGNRADPALAQRYAARMPASMPPAQRAAIEHAIASTSAHANETWAKTIWEKFSATRETIDLARVVPAPDGARAVTLRDEGNALARTEPQLARDRWRDAAALGDLPAQVQLFAYAKRSRIDLGAPYQKSLRSRLEAAAKSGDSGAALALAALFSTHYGNVIALSSASYDVSQQWLETARGQTPAKAQFLRIAQDPTLTEAHCTEVRAAALRETASWEDQARSWGLTGHFMVGELTLSAKEIRATDAQRAQFVGLAVTAQRLETQLPLWEQAIERRAFDPESDARFIQGHEAWALDDEAQRDPVLALDYFAQSTGLGHPLAPLVIAYFYGSGHAGFPKNPAISQRFRALVDARLTAMAETNDQWAQIFLGDLLTTSEDNRDDSGRPRAYEWLPPDKARGLKWLQLAALDGAVLPHNFGDSAGHSVAGFLCGRYGSWEDDASAAKWGRIRELFERTQFPAKPTDAQWAELTTEAQAIFAQTPEAVRALAPLDEAIDAIQDGGAPKALALRARSLALLASNLNRSALRDAAEATCFARDNPSVWRTLAQVQQRCGIPLEAAVSENLARALEGDTAAPALFETALVALAKLQPDEPESLRDTLRGALEDHPDSPVLKDLVARAAKTIPPK